MDTGSGDVEVSVYSFSACSFCFALFKDSFTKGASYRIKRLWFKSIFLGAEKDLRLTGFSSIPQQVVSFLNWDNDSPVTVSGKKNLILGRHTQVQAFSLGSINSKGP
jgi:hypothetical protein